jgi:hypothetical protein
MASWLEERMSGVRRMLANEEKIEIEKRMDVIGLKAGDLIFKLETLEKERIIW